MNADSLARFYAASGRKVIRTESGYWYSASPFIYNNLPSSQDREPSEAELRTLFRQHGVLGVQFPTARPTGVPGARFVVRDREYGLYSLQRQFRQHVQKGLQECEIRELEFDSLAPLGMPVNRGAMSRRDYRNPYFVDPARWLRFCHAGQTTPGAGVMASFVKGALAGYLVYFIVDDTSYGLHMVSRPDLWDHQPNHVLYYSFTKAMMARPDIKTVTLGLRSLPTPRSIDQFKRHAGYASEPCYISLALRPAARFLLQNRATTLALKTLSRFVGSQRHLQRVQFVVSAANRTIFLGS